MKELGSVGGEGRRNRLDGRGDGMGVMRWGMAWAWHGARQVMGVMVTGRHEAHGGGVRWQWRGARVGGAIHRLLQREQTSTYLQSPRSCTSPCLCHSPSFMHHSHSHPLQALHWSPLIPLIDRSIEPCSLLPLPLSRSIPWHLPDSHPTLGVSVGSISTHKLILIVWVTATDPQLHCSLHAVTVCLACWIELLQLRMRAVECDCRADWIMKIGMWMLVLDACYDQCESLDRWRRKMLTSKVSLSQEFDDCASLILSRVE